ncbi:helix-turn-helix transcriptional regulator [Pendulispora brunnea]|uniref:Helix-turn-helix transcriptional regulator n=1 Tax=Pendulispora brunnea TaxID=2905690 RepID=A0ABZ2JVW0_9BACT
MPTGTNDANAAGYAFGAFRFAPESRTLLLFDEPVRLGARGLDLLRILVERAGTVVATDELLTLVWPDVVVDETNLRVQVAALRRVLARGEQGVRSIETVLRGYRFTLPVSPWVDESGETSSNEHTLHNLPALLATVVGRADTIALLADSLAQQRLVTITGPGGVGKTTVAIALARQHLRLFSDGIRFVDFSSLSDPRLVAAELASALGIGGLSNEPLPGLLSHLRKKHMLLVLDTCEHVVDAVADLVESLLSRLPTLRILATSREALRATGEWAHRLPSLPHPTHTDGLSAAAALAYPAVDLFVQRARAIFDRFELHDADAAIVGDICQQLDGMPLAIEFAAARVGELGLREISARLGDRFDVLTRGRRKALPRHQTLAATLNWSYDLLAPEEQVMLRRLSVFRGPFTADAAVAVADSAWPRSATVTYLSNLFAKSLVTVDIGGETPLYRLLDTTRVFASEKLTTGERHEVSARHALHVLALLREVELVDETADSHHWTERHRNVIDNWRAALDWTLSESGDCALGLQLLGTSVLISHTLSVFGECARRLKARFEQMSDMSKEDPAMSSRLWEMYGHAIWHTAEPVEAVIHAFRTSFEVARGAALVNAQLRALWGLYLVFSYNGDYAESLMITKEYEAIAAALDSPEVALARGRMASLAFHGMGDQARARIAAQRVLAEAASPTGKGRPRGLQLDSRVAIRPTLARILWLQGYPKQAWECACEGVELARAIGQPLPLCSMISVGALPIAFWTGRMAVARELAETLFTTSLEHSLLLVHTFAQAYRAILEGTFDTSREPPGGTLLAEMVATMDSTCAVEATLARVDKGYERWCTSELLRIRAERLFAEGTVEHQVRAQALLRRSLDVARSQHALAWELRTAITLAEHAQSGHAEALDRLAAVHERFTEGFDTRDLLQAAALLRGR